MSRFQQLLFAVSVVLLSWFAMMAVHELGHVAGAIVTGGSIERVVLHPLTISRTDVSPNPRPGVVVWLGPVIGCVLPLALFAIIPKRFTLLRNIAQFFSGFCLVANGAYISIGSLDQVGDCREMFRTGTPQWAMLAFGAATVPLGLYMWHCLGSPKRFLADPTVVAQRTAYVTFGVLVMVIVVEIALSPR